MILVAGSANIDFVTRVPHIPAPGETVLGGNYQTLPGGKGANQAVACARAGGRVAFLGALGQDILAESVRKALSGSGVTDLTLTTSAPTGAAFISVSEGGENAITVASGANASLRPEHLPVLTDYQFLILQLEIPLDTVKAYAAAAHAAGLTVVLNAAPARSLPAELLAEVDMLVVNEGELAALVGPGETRQQLVRAQQLGPPTVVVTLGSQGSLTRHGEEWLQIPAFPVTVSDTTGAGDTFVGLLVAALSTGQELEDALHFASVGAALACTRPGAQAGMPTLAEIEAAFR